MPSYPCTAASARPAAQGARCRRIAGRRPAPAGSRTCCRWARSRLDDVKPGRHRRGRPHGRHGFMPAVRASSSRCTPDRQVLMFSATLDGAVGKLAASVQRDPVRHEVGPAGPDMHNAAHAYWTVDASRPVRRDRRHRPSVRLDDGVLPDAPRRRPGGQAARPTRRDRGSDPRRPQPAQARPGARVRSHRGDVVGARRHRRRRPRRARRRRRRRRALRSAGRSPTYVHRSGRTARRRFRRRDRTRGRGRRSRLVNCSARSASTSA